MVPVCGMPFLPCAMKNRALVDLLLAAHIWDGRDKKHMQSMQILLLQQQDVGGQRSAK